MAEFYLSIGNFQEAIEQLKIALTMKPITNIQTAKFIARLNEVEEYLDEMNKKSQMKRKLKIILLPVLILISGCSYQGPLAPDDSDPYEKTNRGIFEFNEDLDKAVLRTCR